MYLIIVKDFQVGSSLVSYCHISYFGVLVIIFISSYF